MPVLCVLSEQNKIGNGVFVYFILPSCSNPKLSGLSSSSPSSRSALTYALFAKARSAS